MLSSSIELRGRAKAPAPSPQESIPTGTLPGYRRPRGHLENGSEITQARWEREAEGGFAVAPEDHECPKQAEPTRCLPSAPAGRDLPAEPRRGKRGRAESRCVIPAPQSLSFVHKLVFQSPAPGELSHRTGKAQRCPKIHKQRCPFSPSP